MRLLLTVTDGPHVGKTFSFEEHATFFVGRAPQVQFRLSEDDPYFSRVHFMVEVNPPLCRLVDMKSTNKTFVNDQQVTTVDLKHGDKIRAGHTTMVVVLIDTTGAATLPPPTKIPPASAAPRPAVEQAAMLLPAEEGPPRLPGYDIVRELGRGAMGVVYLATHQADGKQVAIKTVLPAIKPTPELLGRFLREAEALRLMQHPNIVAFHDLGEADGVLYFAMDYVPGVNASELLKNHGGPLPVNRAVGWLCQVLEALEYAHGKKFVHRDIKPSNFLIVDNGDREEVKLADFGLARTYEQSQLSGLTRTGVSGGTPAYMPPEQVTDFRSARPPADQYSAAAALYHLLTGQYLYDGASNHLELFVKILTEEPVPVQKRRPDLPPPLAAAIHRALRRQPEERFPSVADFRQALLPFA